MLRKVREGFLIVGVGHVLPESVARVRELIAREKPEVVCLELCPARYQALIAGERGTQRLPFLLNLLQIFQRKFAASTGSPVGEEMLAAAEEARKVGASVVLIDQDISETVQQLMGIPLRERILLAFQLLITILLPFGRKSVESLTEEEVVEEILADFRRFFPSAYEVLIERRNRFMAERLIPLLHSQRKVVCVVGAAHVAGLFRTLREEWDRSWASFQIEFSQQVL